MGVNGLCLDTLESYINTPISSRSIFIVFAMTFELTSESYCLEPDASYPFYITAKRYTPVKLSASRNSRGNPLTLILLHSVSFQKEIWEPALQDLFSHFSRKGSTEEDIEAWSIECPNHGYSAILNEKVLRHSDHKLISCESGFAFAPLSLKFRLQSDTSNLS